MCPRALVFTAVILFAFIHCGRGNSIARAVNSDENDKKLTNKGTDDPTEVIVEPNNELEQPDEPPVEDPDEDDSVDEENEEFDLDTNFREEKSETQSAENEYKENIPPRRKRSIGKETLLSKDHHPLEVTLVQLDDEHHRVKRTSFNSRSETWPHHIPYVYSENFDKELINEMEHVLELLRQHLCVNFTNEQDFDHDNPNWFRQHGYSTNAYISFRTSSSCYAIYGRGSRDKGGRSISPCTQFFTMMHEVLHSLGGIHTMNYPHRERYINMHASNMDPLYDHSYDKEDPNSSHVVYKEFDPSSVLMYSTRYFSLNGMTTFDYIRKDMGMLTGPSTYNNILLELTINYRCQETFCKKVDPDCGIGYLGYVNRKCECVCPPGFDASNRCQSVINERDTSPTWPDTPFTMYKAEECPKNMSTGEVPLTVGSPPLQRLRGLPVSGRTLNIGMCTKTTPTKNVNYKLWPMGRYCFGKVKDIPCTFPFVEGGYTMTTRNSATLTGDVGDVDVQGRNVTMLFCCQKEGDVSYPIKLPTDKAFRLHANYKSCQAVDGMWALQGTVILQTKSSREGKGPRLSVSRNALVQTSCYYQPPKYGCSQEFTLDKANPSVTVSVPLVNGKRESNRRCFYYFKAAEKSRLRLTINKMRIHPSDRFYVKRFNLLMNPFKINIRKPPHQMISERNNLLIEYWSFYQDHGTLSGADFTVDLLDADDLCYGVDQQGMDYAGEKTVSETYEECVPWEDATSCPDFPWAGTRGLHLLNSGRSCRNLDVSGMLQPWCYTYVNGTMCDRRYCDVCNEAEPRDMVVNCQKYKRENQNFCSEGLGRFGCFKTCRIDTASYNKDQVKCGRPGIPAGITTQGDLQNSYDVGASLTVSCNGQDTRIECTTHGWTPFDEQCTANLCIDASNLCENALKKFPKFCTNSKSREAALKYCKKSCGVCDTASCSVPDSSSYSLVSPRGRLSTGQDATFACSDGLAHVSGDLRRACSPSGNLLGEEPICQASSPPVDINMAQITGDKRSTVSSTVAYIMLGYGLDIPFDGKITRWYYYCVSGRPITLLVYRKTRYNKYYQLVGSNTATCVPFWPWSYDVPERDQIDVQKGDLLGVWDERSSVSMQSCGNAKERLMPVATQKMRTLKTILNNLLVRYSGMDCAFISIGARVEPN